MACELYECRGCEFYEVRECERGDPDCQAEDCNEMILKRNWCVSHKREMMESFEAQFKKPIFMLKRHEEEP